MQEIVEWATGQLSPQQRIWAALSPALLLCAYGVVSALVYLVRWASSGPSPDPELESRPTTALLGLGARRWFAWATRPLWRLLLWSGLPANAVTALSIVLAGAAGLALAAGRFALGGWLYIFAGIGDFFDGRLARHRGEVARSGGLLDSVLDRYSDAAVLIGLAWYYRGSWLLLVALLALVGSSMVPYLRAKGESLGVELKGVGTMQRAERIACLGVAVALSPIVEALIVPTSPRPVHRVAAAALVFLAVSTNLTALARLIHTMSALGSAPAQSWRERWQRLRRGAGPAA